MTADDLPADFDASVYLELHRDVAKAGVDPAKHYLNFGKREGREYRRPATDIAQGGLTGTAPKEPFHLSHHHPVDRLPDVSLVHHEAQATASSLPIARRLIAAYQHSIAASQPGQASGQPDLWTDIVDRHLMRFVSCLESGDAEGLLALLSDFGKEYTWFGGITTGIDGFNHWEKGEHRIAYSYFDKLVSLAEALGVLPVENPELGLRGNWGKNIHRDPNEVVALIEQALGISILAPLGALPVTGVRLDQGALHYRHINALYTAVRVRDLTASNEAVCEYGGGIGLVALYLARFGRRDYTLFDLPIVNVLSGYMLLSALGEDAVCLEGEVAARHKIKIRTGASSRSALDREFGLALNQDSFPEIDRGIVNGYLADIERTTSRYFLSINHECELPTNAAARHVSVSAMLEGMPRFRRQYRMPYWLRRGYVEELYAVSLSQG